MHTSIRSLRADRMRQREARIRQLQQERDARESAMMGRLPRLAEIRTIQAEIGMDLARLMLGRPTQLGNSIDDLHARSKELTEERESLLKRHGFNLNDLEVWWDCPDCQNTGWLPAVVMPEGTVLPQEKCSCLRREEMEDLVQFAGLTGPLREQTFVRFDLSVYPLEDRRYTEQVLRYCEEFAERVVRGAQEESLLLVGDVGRGKTFLASAIGNVALEAGRTVVYVTFGEFLDLIRLHKFDDQEAYMAGIQRLYDADLIILDDLGAEKATDFAIQELFTLINTRMNRRRPMVVSSNLKPEEFQETYGDRISSRLLNGFEVLGLRGHDVREVLKFRRVQP
jgi:DNA replication protein DnaC